MAIGRLGNMHKDDEIVAFIRENGQTATATIAERFDLKPKAARDTLDRIASEQRILKVGVANPNGAGRTSAWAAPNRQTRRGVV